VQLYLHDEQSAQPRRYKDLRGFARVRSPRPDKDRQFSGYGTRHGILRHTQTAWVVEPGLIDVLVGASSHDIRQTGKITALLIRKCEMVDG